MPHKPTVSVVIICYNQERYIDAAIESVLAQTAIEYIKEIICVDDGSTDGSFSVMEQMATQSPLIRPVKQANSGGCAGPRNAGIQLASGDYVAFLDGDDLWVPAKLETELQHINTAPEAGLFYSNYLEFDDVTGEEAVYRVNAYHADDPVALEKFFVEGGPIVPSTTIMRREIFDVVGVFDQGMGFNEDSEFWLRVALKYPIQHIDAVNIRKRAWFGSLGSDKFAAQTIAAHHTITQRMLSRAPHLSGVVRRREARISLKQGVLALKAGKRWDAASCFIRALCNRPIYPKALGYLGIVMLAPNPSRFVGALKKDKAPKKSFSSVPAGQVVGEGSG